MNPKTLPQHWFDVVDRPLSRRDLLRVVRDVSALTLLGSTHGCVGATPRVRFAADPFSLGVASGDPTSGGAVLWTRLGREVIEAAGLIQSPVPVRWEVASDESFRSIVTAGDAVARPELGHSVHVAVEGLGSGRDYWYRFVAGGTESPIGRTRTAPSSTASPERIRFAFASCQNYEHGYFTALDHLAREEVDLVFHLGDYIYEARFASPDGIVRDHEGGEVTSLSQYRGRYAAYRSEPELQAAHASAPWAVSFDDHEVDNNWAGMFPEDDQTPAQWTLRRAAAFQAFYEFMPLRPRALPPTPAIRIYRRLDYGELARFFVLDTRQYRTDQPCGDRRKVRCPGVTDPGATILGEEQEGWLFEQLASSPARWNVMANQVMVSDLAGVQEGQVVHSMDHWGGYMVSRARFLDVLGSEAVANPVILTGDIHSNWVADVKRDFADPTSPVVAAELVGSSITSGGDGRDGADALSEIRVHNPHIHHFDARRGYVRVDVTSDRLVADYRRVPFVTRRGAEVSTARSFVVRSGVRGVTPA